MTLLQFVHVLACFVVLAEAMNKLEHTAPCGCGLQLGERVLEWLKAIAWILLAIGAACALVTPLVQYLHVLAPDPENVLTMRMLRQASTLPDVCVELGFAVLIVHTRALDKKK